MTNEEILKLERFLLELGITKLMLNGKDLPGLIARGLREFVLEVEDQFDEETKLQAKLHFYRTGAGNYYCPKYNAHLRYLSDPSKDEKQDFYMHEMIISLREAFNLLQGRCVEKEVWGKSAGDQYKAWVKLNFYDIDKYGNYRYLRYRSGLGYDLEKALDFYSNILETTIPEGRAAIIRSLKQGNKELVTFIHASGKRVEKFIEANPKMKTLKIYDQTKKSKKIRKDRTNGNPESNDSDGSRHGEDSADKIATMGSIFALDDYGIVV